MINFFDLERNRQWSHSAILPLFAFNDIVNNRIPEKFPKLRIGFIEAYATWVPYLLHSFKRQFREQWKFPSTQDLFREFRIFIACETSENLPVIVDCIGEDNLVIGSDYGHNDPFEQRNLLPTLKSLTSIPKRVVMVDEETQRNDIEVIRQILKSPDTIPVQRAYDFRFAREADRQLTQSGWRP